MYFIQQSLDKKIDVWTLVSIIHFGNIRIEFNLYGHIRTLKKGEIFYA